MRYSKFVRCLLTSSVIALAFSLEPVNAQDANQQTQIDELARRVTGLETKLDALLDMLQKQANTAPVAAETPVQQSDNAQAAKTTLRPGVTLDIYAVALEKNQKLPPAPVGYPVGSLVIKGEQPFNLAAFTGLDGLSRFAEPSGKSIGQLYTGYVDFPETGDYVFQAAFAKTRYETDRPDYCSTSVIVDGHVVANVVTDVKGPNVSSGAQNGVVKLATGMHQVSLWSICDKEGYANTLTAEVAVKGPSDRAPMVIGTSQFLVPR